MRKRRDPETPKHNPWKDPSPYGTYEGPRGTPADWARNFKQAWDSRTCREIIKSESAWDILGIAPGTSWPEVKKAYRALILKHHPDVGGDGELCRKIVAAYSLLEEQLG